MDDQEPRLRDRRGMSLSSRLRAPDSYGLLLIAILLTMIVAAAAGEWSFGRLLAILLLIGTLVFALRTSRVGPRTMRLALIMMAAPALLGLVSVVVGDINFQRTALGVIYATLIASVLAAVIRRLATHPFISGETVLGALCVYVLIGLLFAAVFGAVDGVTTVLSVPDANVIDYLYFSFVTLTTVGYGDLTAIGDLSRMLAVTEALVGQLYLVSVVALVVGNWGRERSSPDG